MLWSHRSTVTPATLEPLVAQWCTSAARGESVEDILPGETSAINRPLANALRSACVGVDPAAIDITLGRGASSLSPSTGVAATHHAIVRVDEVDRVGIHLHHEPDGVVRIVGFWIF